MFIKRSILYFLCLLCSFGVVAQNKINVLPVGMGWAKNSVNTTVFRKNSLVTFKQYQYIAYYDGQANLVLGKRHLKSTNWTLKTTKYKGNAADAHNVISLMVDGKGYVHVAWDHHNSRLRYAKATEPESLDIGEEQLMVGRDEKQISYPEFFKLPKGDLLFLYRDGGSGGGNLIINRYDSSQQRWERLHSNLIDGEKKRNAYWQAYVDQQGHLHLSWVWRESPNVASNHDMAYAISRDGGYTWQKSTGEAYTLPIRLDNAEYAVRIPENSSLINQTSMAADQAGNPYIVSYWKDASENGPQYKLVYNQDGLWQTKSFDFRKSTFVLGGYGTKEIPIARPQVVIKGKGAKATAYLVFRDLERGRKASLLSFKLRDSDNYEISDLHAADLGAWEPTLDTELWKKKNILSLFVQPTTQIDGEGLADIAATEVAVLNYYP